jgi:beta-phosphoglucomutase-like phosphatase (HAD superfamily)
VIVTGDMGLPGKPEPDIFLRAAQKLSLSTSEALVFEDSTVGIEAAKRANMRAIAICSSHSESEFSMDHVIAAVKNYDDLIRTDFLSHC